MKFLSLTIAMLLASTPVLADDGELTSKNISRNSKLTVEPEALGLHTAEAEHAFIDMMKFYVPSQAASGQLTPIDYNNIDENLVETLEVAKPLVSVYINGPAVGVEDTPFAHSFMDTFGTVSLDDGTTWKPVNLSETADQSSFEIEEGFTIDKDLPVAEADAATPTISEYELEATRKKGYTLHAKGDDALRKARVYIRNAQTLAILGEDKASKSGEWEVEIKKLEHAPCYIQAGVRDVWGPPVEVEGAPEDCDSGITQVTAYPGGVHNVFHATAGNKVLVAWPSRFCRSGQPAYSYAYDGDDDGKDPVLVTKRDAIAAYLGIDVTTDLYLTDLFGVAGSQGSIDFADEGYPQAGEVPFGCVWTARGVLLPGDDPRTADVEESSHMVWTKAERLTSGRRDPNRIEVQGVAGAGFVITWQEDPDGLRPGQGEGPGEGWSGAVAHDKTDVWYSFIPWEYFDLVGDPTDDLAEPLNIAVHDLTLSGRPKAYVPMAVPMRLTNNDKCVPGVTTERFSYCNYDVAQDYGLQNFCADVVSIPQGPQGTPGDICVNAEGLPNLANTASTRPRLSLQGYDSDGENGVDSAWVIVASEESKGLGRYQFLPDGTPCDEDAPDASPDCTADIGKNQWYFSFDMGDPATSTTADEPNGLVQNLVKQGNLLNQPEVDWRTGEYYPAINTSEMWDFGAYNYDLWNTEIARRSSLLVQSIGKAGNSENRLLAIPSWKQGAMRQGGPADTMLRRIVLPAGYEGNEGITRNPYAFENMVCSEWLVDPGANPYYPGGICNDPATNLSSVVPDECLDTDTDADTPCPTVDFASSTYGIGDTNPILQGYIQSEGNTTKVLTWHQCPSDGLAQDTSELEGAYYDCSTDSRTDAFVNLQDQSWYNPLDVSKGHRGFLDGDFVMFLYAWSPNWRLNAVGNDRYDLYVRRSFDGGQTWTTLPESFTASDDLEYTGGGTVTCETYRSTLTQVPQAPEPHVCYGYPTGGNEQARNVTQHKRMRITTLDPRYAPTAATIGSDCVSNLNLPGDVDASAWSCDDTSALDSDLRNPSRYFMVYETGDNTTVTEGEAEPLDLYYSRAVNFGDDYLVWAEESDLSVCYPADPHGDEDVTGTVLENSGFCNEFDRLNTGGDTHSSEANLEGNPDGSKLYGVWAQWVFDEAGEEVVESNAQARRVWWIENYISDDIDNTWGKLIGGGGTGAE
ncbi:MAG: choice-of-anchor O protein [Candidatus Thiodiazotropha sp.]